MGLENNIWKTKTILKKGENNQTKWEKKHYGKCRQFINLRVDPFHMFRIIWIKCFSTMNLKNKIWNKMVEKLVQKNTGIYSLEKWQCLTSSHLIKWAYSIQWAAVLGVSARVHKGNFTWGGKSQMVHSKHGVTPGMITLAWPLKPSVPPSTIGLIVSSSGLSSESYSKFPKTQWDD